MSIRILLVIKIVFILEFNLNIQITFRIIQILINVPTLILKYLINNELLMLTV